MARSVAVGIPAVREWIIKTTGFLGGLFPTPLYLWSLNRLF